MPGFLKPGVTHVNNRNKRRLRYCDLVDRGIVKNRVTLRNWIRDRGFPCGVLAGPNTRQWSEDEVDDWLATRPTAPKPTPNPKDTPKPKRPRGRPRKHGREQVTAI
jgi:predicted DNA-binding transcriptional regulator AlpA